MLLIAMSTLAFGNEVMPQDKQIEYVESIAKDFRKTFWQMGHINVSSHVEALDLETIKELTESERNYQYEQPLDDEEITAIFRCYYRDYCKVYRISLGSEYWGGYGEEAKYVFLNIEMGNHSSIEHTVYSE